MVTEKKEIKGS